MKKYLLLFLLFPFICGCFRKEEKMDFDKIKKNLKSITLEQLDYDNLVHEVEEDLTKMDSLNEKEMTEQTEILKADYQKMIMRISKEKGSDLELYIIISPEENKKEVIKEKVKAYFKTLEDSALDEEEKKHYEGRLEMEYGNDLIYVLSKNADELIDKIKEAKEPVFPELILLENEDLQEIFHFQTKELDRSQIHISKSLDQVGLSLIIKPAEGQESSVRQKINTYIHLLEESFQNDQVQYELIQNRLETEVGSYIVYIISKDNEKVLKMIESYYK